MALEIRILQRDEASLLSQVADDLFDDPLVLRAITSPSRARTSLSSDLSRACITCIRINRDVQF